MKQLPDNLYVHGWPHTQGSRLSTRQPVLIFRGGGWACHQIAVLIFHHIIHKKLRRVLHNGISPGSKGLGRMKCVMFPKVQAQPCRTHWPQCVAGHAGIRCRIRPYICVVMGDKSSAVIELRRGMFSVFPYSFNEIKQWKMAFAQIAHFRRPVIHFRIDIDRIF